jgi:hypothetical protein
MTISRRDTLRLAAAAVATQTPAFAVSPQVAAAELAAPAMIDPPRAGTFGYELDDPVSFAESIDSADFIGHTSHGGAQQWAAYKHALLAVEDAVAGAIADEPTRTALMRLLGQLNDDAVDMATLSWMGGVRAGAAYEHLRLALSAPTEVCPACQGYGRARQDRRAGISAECSQCEGSGVMPAARPVLSLTAD